MIQTFFKIFYLIVIVIGITPRLWRIKRKAQTMSPQEKDRLVYKTTNWFGKKMVRVAGSTVQVNGIENVPKDKPVLVVSNHQSDMDIPVLLGYLNKPIGFVSKAEIKKFPIVPTWMELMNCVFMDRSNRRQSLQAIKDGIELLKNGHSIVIFPEGTRSKAGEMGEFKAGSFHLAVKAGVAILPVTVDGTYKMFEANGNRMKPAHATVTISKPITPEQYASMDIKELTQHTKDIIAAQLHK
ncbi:MULTISPECIES: lysophospholipid acyltransferase family protein [Bacillus]|uniref:1-acyl-sn-glycerol-3-phosphate acyltransferase n=1 Tax=Bacillus pseudomycoides TaxID=64104 RepID=A0A2A8B3M3_9BACI|nr:MULTISPECIES: lysophospholipid acyltransferase family protein [Bacillus]EEM05622.1 1-acyl-sn-glycerol-3-phosphate acyltransferase [Bacillus pseudomycoides]EEM17062.1 1-acyl-sn-glycerol-3-phosphate acyltransferase [Bacillus pseudomycoides DSM 12442]MBJ8029618.1 1-acyl-sn-glycerol-3-phosphate acyltransferase [Bacillus cereus group sp. N21]MED1538170.1 lysophospholipid acyltransferase family protein [Bacillus pseudomycoides]MED1598757.1 lysophospholipid acyltransferase family protein [Bacillus